MPLVVLLVALGPSFAAKNFPDFAASDLMRHARANQLTGNSRDHPNHRHLRKPQNQRKLRPVSPDRPPQIKRPSAPKKYVAKPPKMYDQNGNRVKKTVLPQVIQPKKPYYPPPQPPKQAALKQRVVKAPRPVRDYEPKAEAVPPTQPPPQERPSYERPPQERPAYRERPSYQYKRPEEQPTIKRNVDISDQAVVDEVVEQEPQPSYLQPRQYDDEDEEPAYTARSGPAFAPSNIQPAYVESPYGYAPPPEQRAIQEAVLDGANAYNSQDPEVYQTEDRLSFHIQGHDGPHSYRYGYDTGHGYNRQFRYEERDGKGYLKGRYGFFDKYGKLQVTNYSADPYEGFHAEGAAVPEYPH